MSRILSESIQKHWKDPKNLIQVLLGPRQVGKTTLVTEYAGQLNKNSFLYASADLPSPPTPDFIITHWDKARNLKTENPTLILDEIQKIPRWSETIKMLWDEDQRSKKIMNIWLLGSSAILIEKGLSESLTGRFELNFLPHWIFAECEKTFDATLEDYVRWGGYPKVYSLKDDEARCLDYIQNSIIETTLGRDILTLHAVDKPALLRQLFWYVSKLPSQIVSYEKILGHLQGKGNSATLVHYAELLHMAFVLIPLSKFSKHPHQVKRSRPKWIIPNPALVDSAVSKEGLRGFVFENLVGSHLANLLYGRQKHTLNYWREDPYEMDFIITDENVPLLAIEVKSGRVKRLPSKETLKQCGLDCPMLVIDQKNVRDFLRTKQIENALNFNTT